VQKHATSRRIGSRRLPLVLVLFVATAPSAGAASPDETTKLDCGVNSLFVLLQLQGRSVPLDSLLTAAPRRRLLDGGVGRSFGVGRAPPRRRRVRQRGPSPRPSRDRVPQRRQGWTLCRPPTRRRHRDDGPGDRPALRPLDRRLRPSPRRQTVDGSHPHSSPALADSPCLARDRHLSLRTHALHGGSPPSVTVDQDRSNGRISVGLKMSGQPSECRGARR